MSNIAKSDILATNLSILHNYFDDPTKLFSDLYLAKFLDTSENSFFSCRNIEFHMILYEK